MARNGVSLKAQINHHSTSFMAWQPSPRPMFGQWETRLPPICSLVRHSLNIGTVQSGERIRARISLSVRVDIHCLKIYCPLVLKIIERNYFALRSMAECDSLAPGLFQACIDTGNIEVAMACLRIDPGAEPTI